MKKIIIAIDGPAGSGKSTTAKLAAQKLGYTYIDTGAMYRAAALAWQRTGGEQSEDALKILMEKISIELKNESNGLRTYLNGEDVSEEIRTPEISRLSSPISAYGCVREKLVELQRKMGANGGVVLDGRDIGTVVFPNAELKIFLVASLETRAQRRFLELKEKGIEQPIDSIASQLAERDFNDSNRSNSPLRQAEDAVLLDTSSMSIEKQTEFVVNLALDKING
jgi:cytidylate kinase